MDALSGCNFLLIRYCTFKLLSSHSSSPASSVQSVPITITESNTEVTLYFSILRDNKTPPSWISLLGIPTLLNPPQSMPHKAIHTCAMASAPELYNAGVCAIFPLSHLKCSHWPSLPTDTRTEQTSRFFTARDVVQDCSSCGRGIGSKNQACVGQWGAIKIMVSLFTCTLEESDQRGCANAPLPSFDIKNHSRQWVFTP